MDNRHRGDRRVVEAVNPDQMRASLAVCRDNIVSSLKGCHVIIDGKKLRGENPTSKGCNGLYILNAMVSDYEICVAEERVDDKTNELTVLPSVIASLCITPVESDTIPEDDKGKLIFYLDKFCGKKVDVMKALGITAPTLDKRLEKYGIDYKLFKKKKERKPRKKKK